jgi:hypothetical protein
MIVIVVVMVGVVMAGHGVRIGEIQAMSSRRLC